MFETDDALVPDEEAIRTLSDHLPVGTDLILGIGSGVITAVAAVFAAVAAVADPVVPNERTAECTVCFFFKCRCGQSETAKRKKERKSDKELPVSSVCMS